MTAPGHKYLSEEVLQRIALERGIKLSRVGEQPEVHVVDVRGEIWRGVKK